MALKFNCLNCGKELIYSHLQIGQTGVCKHCGQNTIVPSDALTIDAIGQQSNFVREKKTSNGISVQEPYPALNAMRQLLYAIGILSIVVNVIFCFILISTMGPLVIIYGIGAAISSLVLIAFAELIRLFIDIEKHLRIGKINESDSH